jgi:hypothetical protein
MVFETTASAGWAIGARYEVIGRPGVGPGVGASTAPERFF